MKANEKDVLKKVKSSPNGYPGLPKQSPAPKAVPAPKFLQKNLQAVMPPHPVGEARGSTDVKELEKRLGPLRLKVRVELKPIFMQVANNDSNRTRLDLSNSQLTQSEIIYLAEALKTNTTITELNLSNNKLDNLGIKCLAEALKTNTTITELDLRNCSINNIAGMKQIVERVETRASKQAPITLNLGGNNLDQLFYSFQYIMENRNKWLYKMITQGLDQNIIMDDKPLLEAYGYVFPQNSQAVMPPHLVVEARGSTDVGGLEKRLGPLRLKVRDELEPIFKQVANNDSNRTRLDLSNSQLTRSEIRYLAEALKTNTTITELNLSNSQLDNLGIKCLADALKANTTLTGLDLRNCSIKITGMKQIVERVAIRASKQAPITVNLGRNNLDQLPYSFRDIMQKNQGSLRTQTNDRNEWLCEMITQGLDQNIIMDDKPLREAYGYAKLGGSIIPTPPRPTPDSPVNWA